MSWHQRFYIAYIQSSAELFALTQDEPIALKPPSISDEQTLSPDERLLHVGLLKRYAVNRANETLTSLGKAMPAKSPNLPNSGVASILPSGSN